MKGVLLAKIETEFDYLLQMLPLTDLFGSPEQIEAIARIRSLLEEW